MKYLRIAISLMMILASGSMNAHAQTKPKPKLYIWMKELSELSLKCGIRIDPIKTSATLVLRKNDIEVSRDMSFPFLWIYVVSMPNSDALCTSYVSVSIQNVKAGTNINGFSSKSENIMLCYRGVMVRTTKSDANKYVSEQAESLLKSCLAEIDY